MNLFAPAVLGLVLSLLLTPAAARLAPHIGAVDIPLDSRRMHHRPTPRTGGVALFVAFLLGAALIPSPWAGLLPLLQGAALVVLAGILDDVFRLPPGVKLAFQLAAAWVALGSYRPAGLALWGRTLSLGPLALPLSLLWVVALINAHNMIDGLDALAGSVSAAEAAALSALLAWQGREGETAAALLLGGAILGFLPYNRHPARTFMGDTGSQLLGLVLGVLSLRLDSSAGSLGALILPLLFALPLSDLVFAVGRRTLRGKSPFAADRGHWHHRLCDRGLGQRRTAQILVLFSALGGGIALLCARDETLPYAVYLTLLTVGVLQAVDLRCAFHRDRRKNASF